jgi:butyryl-CoA dehydrogenase
MAAIKKLMDDVLSGTTEEVEEGPLVEARSLVAKAKKIGLFAAGIATQKYMQAIQDEQEIMGAIANMVIETYAMESAVLRAHKLVTRNGEGASVLPMAMASLYAQEAMQKIENAAKTVIAACADGDMLRSQMAILRRLCKYDPFNVVSLRRTIAQRVIDTGKYQVT